MLVAISQRKTLLGERKADALEQSYTKYFKSFGAEILPIPNISRDIRNYFDNFDIKRIVLSGGGDINPELYSQKTTYSKDVCSERDSTEKKLLEIAIERKIPVFGICRGMQFINVFFGGSLNQKIADYTKLKHVGETHPVKITEKGLVDILGEKGFKVNSYHNRGIFENNLSKQLRVFAIAPDSLIEGLYHPLYPIAGVQWHPERDKEQIENRKIVEAFMNEKLFWK